MANMKKLGVGGVFTLFLVFILGAYFYPVVADATSTVSNEVFTVETDNEFTQGTLTNLTTSDGLLLESTETSGLYVSETFDTTGTDWNETVVDANISNPTNTTLTLTVEFSNDDFGTVENSKTVTLSDGTNNIDVSGNTYEDVRVKLDYSRVGTSYTSPKTLSYEVNGTRSGFTSTLLTLVLTMFVLSIVVFGAKYLTN